ncbi:MAG: TlpA disulfide reductase family protein [Pseudomonadota bacterium]
MRLITAALLYLAAAMSANAGDYDAISEMRTGDMQKLVFHAEPEAVSENAFYLPDESAHTLADFKGKYILVNFWATWCAPCRKEMPMLAELQEEFGGDSFEVVTIATGRNQIEGMRQFFDDIEVDNLPMFRDPRQAVARDMAVLGLPITVILDPEGQEIARLRGDADWASDNAKAIVAALTQPEG